MRTRILVLILLPLLATAQDSAPLVRSSTRVVLLDVVVTDKAGKPIRTLTQDDFTIFENGQPQKISSFEAPLATQSSVLPSSPRTIIILDELNAAFADLAYARDSILSFLTRNHLEHTPTALMKLNLHGLSILEDYTQDERLLKERLTKYRPAMINPVEGATQQAIIQEHAQTSINSLVNLAQATMGSSYNLNVIWVTNGLAGALRNPTSGDGTVKSMRRLANLLMNARIRLYSIDPGGVNPLPANVVAAPMTSELSAGNKEPGVLNNDDLASDTAYEANEFLNKLTAMTGGRAYYGRNDVDMALGEAVSDGAANYSISYSPSNGDFKGEYRKIAIRTKTEGAIARTRLGYYAAAEEAVPSQEAREARWTAALASPLNYSAFVMSCPVNYNPANNRATGTMTVKPTPLIMQSEQQMRQIIRVAAISGSGAVLTNWSWQIDWKRTWTNRVTTASFDKVLPKKTQSVRFLVSDPTSEYMGTCDYRLR